MEAMETVHVDALTVSCDGGGGALGHPAVYLKLGDPGFVVYPYCSRRFVHGTEAAPGDA